MINCQECGSSENVRRVYNMETKEEIGLQCWDCRKDRVWGRIEVTGTLKSEEDIGKKGDEQTSLMNFT